MFLLQCLTSLSSRVPDLEVRLATATASAMCVCLDRIERFGRYLTRNEAKQIKEAMDGFVFGYCKLATLNVQCRTPRWKLIPKLHVMRHMAEDAEKHLYNPKYHHTFKDEDTVGLLKHLCVAVHKGGLLEFRVLTRWLLRLRFWEPQQASRP